MSLAFNGGGNPPPKAPPRVWTSPAQLARLEEIFGGPATQNPSVGGCTR
jgi:hypothetical protein